jgi:hypothetical protein
MLGHRATGKLHTYIYIYIYIKNKPIKGEAIECPFSSYTTEILSQDNQNILNYL